MQQCYFRRILYLIYTASDAKQLKRFSFNKPVFSINQYITMYLNLKSKRVMDVLNANLRHPKSQREELLERSSKDHKESKTNRQTNTAFNKKQTASTAMTTLQHANSSHSNAVHHYVIQSIEKQPEGFSRSLEKVDSQRNQRIANIYKKIKKQDTDQHSYAQQRPLIEVEQTNTRKSNNRAKHSKKEMLATFANNYIAITESNQCESHHEKQPFSIPQLIEPLLEIFNKQSYSKSPCKLKLRSLSSKEIEMNKSLERHGKSSTRKNKKNSKDVIKERQRSEECTLHLMIDEIRRNIVKANAKMENIPFLKGRDSEAQILRQFLRQLDQFTIMVFQKCVGMIGQLLEKYQEGVTTVLKEQEEVSSRCNELQSHLSIERQKTKALLQCLEQSHNKNLYSSVFMNQLSRSIDLDTFIREKIQSSAEIDSLSEKSRISQDRNFSSSMILKSNFLQQSLIFDVSKKMGGP